MKLIRILLTSCCVLLHLTKQNESFRLQSRRMSQTRSPHSILTPKTKIDLRLFSNKNQVYKINLDNTVLPTKLKTRSSGSSILLATVSFMALLTDICLKNSLSLDNFQVLQAFNCKPNYSWQKCTLIEKVALNDRFTRYKFTTTSRISQLSCKIELCANLNGDVCRNSYFSVRQQRTSGFFSTGECDVVIFSDAKQRSNKSVDELLLELSVGDELACRDLHSDGLGLDYRAAAGCSPVDNLAVITDGLSIVPTLNLVVNVLSDHRNSVDVVDLIWTNSRREDFVLEDRVEALQSRFPGRLFVSRVVNSNVNSSSISSLDSLGPLEDRLLDALPVYRPGRLLLLLGSDATAGWWGEKARETLQLELGYPSSCVLTGEALINAI